MGSVSFTFFDPSSVEEKDLVLFNAAKRALTFGVKGELESDGWGFPNGVKACFSDDATDSFVSLGGLLFSKGEPSMGLKGVSEKPGGPLPKGVKGFGKSSFFLADF